MQHTTQQTENPKETKDTQNVPKDALLAIAILTGLLISTISILLRKNENH